MVMPVDTSLVVGSQVILTYIDISREIQIRISIIRLA